MKTNMMTVRLKPYAKIKLEQISKKKGITISVLVRTIIRNYLENPEKFKNIEWE